MAENTSGKGPLSEEELQDLVSSSDAGSRDPAGAVGMLLAIVALVWSLFQVLLASPIAKSMKCCRTIGTKRLTRASWRTSFARSLLPGSPPQHRSISIRLKSKRCDGFAGNNLSMRSQAETQITSFIRFPFGHARSRSS